VVPLFFAVGAIANRFSYENASARGDRRRVWVWRRMERIIRPVTYYFAFWLALSYGLALFDGDLGRDVGHMATQLVWFLGAYVLVIASTPLQVRLARFGVPVVVVLLALVAIADLGRFHVSIGIALANFVVVFFLAATYGLVMYDRLGRGPAGFAAIAIAALMLNIALVIGFPYPVSMVSMPDDRVSNMAPPTLVLALHTILLVSIAGFLWPWLTRLCAHAWVWRSLWPRQIKRRTSLWVRTLNASDLGHRTGIAPPAAPG
jgi:hypothetical protein